MTAPGVTTGDFLGVFVPPDVQQKILSLLVAGSPFAGSLTQLPTTRSSVGFPTAAPSGFGWIGELDPIPQLTLNDDADLVAIKKLAGLIDLSNEMVNDSTVNITTQLQQLLADSMGPELDDGLLHGDGTGNNPAGVVGVATAVTGTTLLDGVSKAKGEIADAGGTPNTIAASGATLAAADTTTAATSGNLMFPSGFAAATGLRQIVVPGLAEILVYDSTRLYTVINRQLSSVDISTDYHFANDATSLRIKARVAVGCPAPAKSIRKIAVGP